MPNRYREEIEQLFPWIPPTRVDLLLQLPALYADWNAKINLISRKDIDALMPHHVYHSLCIGACYPLAAGTTALDFGTGGGFPGIPLAIAFPDVQFHLIDSVGKKVRVVEDIAQQLGLTNVTTQQVRGEELTGHYTYVVSRAVAELSQLWRWVRPLLPPVDNLPQPNGLLALKGGDFLHRELAPFGKRIQTWPLRQIIDSDYYDEKFLIFVPAAAERAWGHKSRQVR